LADYFLSLKITMKVMVKKLDNNSPEMRYKLSLHITRCKRLIFASSKFSYWRTSFTPETLYEISNPALRKYKNIKKNIVNHGKLF